MNLTSKIKVWRPLSGKKKHLSRGNLDRKRAQEHKNTPACFLDQFYIQASAVTVCLKRCQWGRTDAN